MENDRLVVVALLSLVLLFIVWDTRPEDTASSDDTSTSTSATASVPIDPSSDWQTHTDVKSGRVYYWSQSTKAVAWQKPFELMTEAERAAAAAKTVPVAAVAAAANRKSNPKPNPPV